MGGPGRGFQVERRGESKALLSLVHGVWCSGEARGWLVRPQTTREAAAVGTAALVKENGDLSQVGHGHGEGRTGLDLLRG